MMRPMKLGGEQILFGRGCLGHLATLRGEGAVIVTGGSSMSRNGVLDRVRGYLQGAGMKTGVFQGVEPDPSFPTVLRGASFMRDFGPDWIVAVGGGSAMDAAKAMWVYYEHPELSRLEDILPPAPFPRLRARARLVCIPSTAGTASEVSRSIVITDEKTGLKNGVGNMEMVPDVALCDPEVTLSLPPSITAETGMDALTHALESLVSRRANYLSNILASAAAREILVSLPRAFRNGADIEAREAMMNASMTAGLAFTNVSLGIVHSIAHTVGGCFGIAHGLADAIVLPLVMRYNMADPTAAALYSQLAADAGVPDLIVAVEELNAALSIPRRLSTFIPDRAVFEARLEEMVRLALRDGCTKTNPLIPEEPVMRSLLLEAYDGAGASR